MKKIWVYETCKSFCLGSYFTHRPQNFQHSDCIFSWQNTDKGKACRFWWAAFIHYLYLTLLLSLFFLRLNRLGFIKSNSSASEPFSHHIKPPCNFTAGFTSIIIQSKVSIWLGRSRGNSIPACSASSRLTASVAVAGGCVGSEARGEGGVLARLGSPEFLREMESAGEGLRGDREAQQGRSFARARLKSLMNSG